MMISSAVTRVTTPARRAITTAPESRATFSSSPVPTSGASGNSSGTDWRCMLEPMSARLASSCSRNGISAAAIDTSCSGATSAKIDFMDVAPEQLVSIAAALIPFLEHDDANRALMGSNMQRQSVPLLFPLAPLVGTGLEEKVARDSGAVVIARRAGVVTRVTADEIIIDTGEEEATSEQPLGRLKQHDRYRLKKFWRTNQDTAINQRPLVHVGQKVKAGQIVADGAGTDQGQLALGANVVVAFMPWYGHNFEDAIVLSERLVKDDVYSSIHIQELELHVRDTKRGREEITREIPNV